MGVPAPPGVSGSGVPPAGDKANAVMAGSFVAVGPSRPFPFVGPMNLAIWASALSALTVTAGSLAATAASGAGLAVGDAINSVLVPPGAVIAAIAGTAITLALAPQTYTGTILSNGQVTGMQATAGLLGAVVTSRYYPVGTTVTGIIAPAVAGNDRVPAVGGVIQLSNAPSSLPPLNRPTDLTFSSLTGAAITASGTDAAATFTGSNIGYTGSIQMERSFDGGKTWLVGNVGGSGTMAIWAAGTPVSLTFGEPELQVLYRLNCTAISGALPINYRFSQTGGAAEALAIGQLT